MLDDIIKAVAIPDDTIVDDVHRELQFAMRRVSDVLDELEYAKREAVGDDWVKLSSLAGSIYSTLAACEARMQSDSAMYELDSRMIANLKRSITELQTQSIDARSEVGVARVKVVGGQEPAF